MIEFNLPHVNCKCGGSVGYVEKSKYQNRYKLICKDCEKFVRFAKADEKALILARVNWLKEHNYDDYCSGNVRTL